MATNLKNESIYNLQMYIQFAETLSGEMSQFFQEGVQKHMDSKTISQSFYDEMKETISKNVAVQNELVKSCEKEIQNRIVAKFPQLVSFKHLTAIGKSLDAEIIRMRDLLKDKDETPIKTPSFSPSREKRHDKK